MGIRLRRRVTQLGSRSSFTPSLAVCRLEESVANDLHYLVEAVDKDWFGRGGEEQALGARVLVAEGSPFSRGLMRNDLEMAGYRVLEAGSSKEALHKLNGERVDVLVSSLDLPGEGPLDLLRRIRTSPELCALPTLALATTAEQTEKRIDQQYQFDDCQLKFDRDAMLTSVEKLAAALAEQQPVTQEAAP